MRSFPSLGEELGGYRVEELIGRGGMSVVYLAEQLALGRKVALKLLSPDLSEDEEFRQRFIRESRLAGGLEHPNIIPVHEAGDVEGLLFIAMRYVKGSDLKALLKREGPLSLEKTHDLMSQAASALDAAHARGLVHRDVKPGNLLIASGDGPEEREHVYLSDFGLTKKTDSKSRMTSTGQFVGTLDYVAPEQIQGKDVSGPTDIYSLACVVCECLTGAVPFERNSDVAVMYAHLQDPPPKLSELRDDVPPAVDDVISRAMAKEPGDRFPSCREFMKALREAGDTQAASAAPKTPRLGRRRKEAPKEKAAVAPPPPQPVVEPEPEPEPQRASQEATQPGTAPERRTDQLTTPARKLDRRVLIALVLVPLLAVGAFLMTRDGGEEPEEDTRTNVAGGGPTDDASPDNTGGNGARFPGRLAYLVETEPGSEDFYVAVAEPPDARPQRIEGTEGFDWRNRRPDWAPNGDFFAYATPAADRTLDMFVIDPTRPGRPLEQHVEPGGQGSVNVSPDGTKVSFSAQTDGNLDVWVWDLESGRSERLTDFPGVDDSPEWSPDGDQIVFEREAEGGNDIYVMDADGSNVRAVTQTPNVNEKIPEFHPTDPTLVLFHRQEFPGGQFDVYVHSTEEPPKNPGTPMLETPDNEGRATWSIDGNWIAYDSDARGNLDVFVIPFEGLDDPPDADEAIRITKGPQDEQSPAWGPSV